MEGRRVKTSLWLSLVLMSTTMKFASSTNDDFDECLYRLKEIFVQEVLSDVGVSLLKWNTQSSTSFVYSDLQVVEELLNVLYLGSPKISKRMKDYLAIRGDNCYTGFCNSFETIVDDMQRSLGRPLFDYNSMFYGDSNSVFKHKYVGCGRRRYLEFKFREETQNRINENYQVALSYYDVKCIKKDLSPDTRFFLLSCLRMRPTIFGKILSYKYDYPFIDLNARQHNVEWLGTTGTFWTARTQTFPFQSNPYQSCRFQVYRTEINKGDQYMLYFMPFPKPSDKAMHVQCLEEILYNQRIYVEQTIDKTIEIIEEYPADFTTLLAPVMNISTETDLTQHLLPVMSEIFQGNQITNLYKNDVRLSDLRTCDYMYNKDKEYAKGTVPKRSFQIGLLYLPFVFTIVDKRTNIFIKTGVYFGPQ